MSTSILILVFHLICSTAMRITPQKFDFYLVGTSAIADRVEYKLQDGKWDKYHIAA